MNYDDYNREERALCAHLFRLLHERLATMPKESGLARFLAALASAGEAIPTAAELRWRNIAVHTEVALIRDAYFAREIEGRWASFMKGLIDHIAKQEQRVPTPYTELPYVLKDPRRTHTKQIAAKWRELEAKEKKEFKDDDKLVYSALQAMFNAKPDLAITVDDWLIVVEAKFTQPFDDEQMLRTRKIAEAWRDMLHQDLGFAARPRLCMVALGLENSRWPMTESCAHVTWEQVAVITDAFYGAEDRSLMAFRKAVMLQQRMKAAFEAAETKELE